MLYKCNSCDYYSNRKFNLQIHVQRKHANENLEIEENVNENVNENANAIVNVSSENATESLKPKYFCTICMKVFSTRQGKYQHMKKKIKKCKPPATLEEKVKSTDSPGSGEEIIILKDQIEKLKRRMRGFTETDKKKIAAGQNWKCNICKVSLPYDYHVDHIMPIHAGGFNERSNGQALCVECHKEKTFREKK